MWRPGGTTIFEALNREKLKQEDVAHWYREGWPRILGGTRLQALQGR
jgi:hypothetical protein